MERSRSPVSENTVRQLIENEYLSDNSVTNVLNYESDGERSFSSSQSSVVDDTDSDPNYNPPEDRPSTSGMGDENVTFSSSESDNDVTPRVTNASRSFPVRSRGRPPQTASLVTDNSSDSENGNGWAEVGENNDPGYTHNFGFQELPGLKHCPPRNSSPVTYFRLFFTTAILENFVKYTNLYADQFIFANRDSFKEYSRSKKWKPVTVLEMQAFISVLINMGLIKKPTIYSYWWTGSSQYIPWFGRMFTRNRFQAILQFFHLVDTRNLPKPREPNYDPCARFNPLVEHVNRLFKFYFTPGQNLSIDESMISTKIRSQLLQYIPKKHHRWGVKLWMICDAAASYCLNFFVYTGAAGTDRNEIKRKGLGYIVVLKL